MAPTIKGSCLCGSVRYEVAGELEGFFLCHCSRCRKGTGSAHAANIFSRTATLTWLQGEELVKSYKVPDTRHQRSFCSNCSSALPRLQMNGAFLVVPAGSIDGDFSMQPTAHICMASRAAWDNGLEHLPKLEGLPMPNPAVKN